MLSYHPSAGEFHINGVYLFIALEGEPVGSNTVLSEGWSSEFQPTENT